MRISDWSSDVCSSDLRAHRESLEEQIAETGFERAVLFEGLDPEATLTDWEEKLATAVRRIERLGAINLAAIQELEEAQARETYLGEQHDDLDGALETLEEAIKKIDLETKELFKQIRKSTRLNSSHYCASSMPSYA